MLGDSTITTHPAIGYLRSLFKEGDRLCFAFIDPSTHHVEHQFIDYAQINDKLIPALDKRAQAGANVYVCLNAIKAGSTNRTKDDVGAIRTCYVDVDADGPSAVDKIEHDVFMGVIPEPEFVLESSPGKRQVIWILEDGVSTETQEAMNGALVRRFGGDTACRDVVRVFRIPGYENKKYDAKPVVTILHTGDGVRHSIAEFKLDLDVERSIPARPPADDSILRWTVDRVEMNLRDAHIDTSDLQKWGTKGWLWIFDECPWAHEHTTGPGGATLILHKSGALDFNCLHGHCSDRTFETFKTYANGQIGDPHRSWGTPKDADPADFMDASEINSEGVILVPATPAAATTPTASVDDWRSSFRSLHELKPGGVQFLIEQFFHEGSTFFGAMPGHSKTWLALSVAKALTTGEPFLGKFKVLKKTPVLYLVPDDAQGPFRKRAERFGLPNDEKNFLVRTMSEGPTLGLDHPHILEAVRQLKPVVMLDTFIHFNDVDDENSSAQNRKIIQAIADVLIAGAPAVISLHHAPKSFAEGEMTLEACLRGSSAIAASAHCVWALRRDDVLRDNGHGPEELDLVCAKPRNFDEPPMPLRIASRYRSELTQEILSYFDLLHDFKIVGAEEDQQTTRNTFVQLVTDNPKISVKDVAKALKIRWTKVNAIAASAGYAPKERGPWEKDSKPSLYVPGDKEPEAE